MWSNPRWKWCGDFNSAQTCFFLYFGHFILSWEYLIISEIGVWIQYLLLFCFQFIMDTSAIVSLMPILQYDFFLW